MDFPPYQGICYFIEGIYSKSYYYLQLYLTILRDASFFYNSVKKTDNQPAFTATDDAGKAGFIH